MHYSEIHTDSMARVYLEMINDSVREVKVEDALMLLDFLGWNHANSAIFDNKIHLNGLHIRLVFLVLMDFIKNYLPRFKANNFSDESEYLKFLGEFMEKGIAINQAFENFIGNFVENGKLSREEAKVFVGEKSLLLLSFVQILHLWDDLLDRKLSEFGKKVISLDEFRQKLKSRLQILDQDEFVV